MTAGNFVDHLGRPLTLGPKLGAGGEGIAFSIANAPGLVAKIYHKPPSAQQIAKLQAMIALARKELCDIAAWPTATLHERPGVPPRGFVMRQINDFKEVHFLYSPAHRKVSFPEADWKFLIHTAMNCAAAFDTIHANGVVIGDVNQGNVLVSKQGLVALIDCDSYKVHLSGHYYPCSEVGIDLFTPPELQGRPFRGVNRTQNHDRFGLAVLIFYLLFMNRHPFAGRYLGKGEMAIGQAIEECRFAYGRAARNYQMQTPLHALPLSAVSSPLVDLFERAFGPGSVLPDARPTPAEWQGSLKSFLGSLRPCTSDIGHVYAPHLPKCPWHALMQQGAPNLFVTVAYFRNGAGPVGPIFDLTVVWARIEQVLRPQAAYIRPTSLPACKPIPWPAALCRAVPPKPTPSAVLSAPPPMPALLRVDPTLPPKPVVPTILSTPPVMPPALLAGPAIPPRPFVPTILTTPSAMPLTLRAEPTLPPRPTVPPILTSPSIPTAMIIPPAQHHKRIIKANAFQQTMGYAAALCVTGFIPVGLAGMIVGVIVLGPAGIKVGLLGIVVIFGFFVCGTIWIILELLRRQREGQLNHEYEEELERLRIEARRKLKHWEASRAAEQALARQSYRAEVARWEHQVAATHAAAQRQRDEWESRLAIQRTEARQQYDLNIARWEQERAAIHTMAQRQRDEWESDLKAQQGAAQQQYDAEVSHWEQTAAPILAESQRRRTAWESQIAAQQAEARRRYQEELRGWEITVAALRAEAERRRRGPAEARMKAEAAEQSWTVKTDRFTKEFDRKKAELPPLRDRHAALAKEYSLERRRLQSNAREVQFGQFLQQTFISDHTIPMIGAGRKATLAAYGVETAFDVVAERILEVPSFGPGLTGQLVQWRQTVEAQFVFNATAGIPPHMQQALDAKFARVRFQFEAALLAGEQELKSIAARAESELRQWHEYINTCWRQVIQADADTTAIPPGV